MYIQTFPNVPRGQNHPQSGTTDLYLSTLLLIVPSTKLFSNDPSIPSLSCPDSDWHKKSVCKIWQNYHIKAYLTHCNVNSTKEGYCLSCLLLHLSLPRTVLDLSMHSMNISQINLSYGIDNDRTSEEIQKFPQKINRHIQKRKIIQRSSKYNTEEMKPWPMASGIVAPLLRQLSLQNIPSISPIYKTIHKSLSITYTWISNLPKKSLI